MRKIDRMPNARVRELCGVKIGVAESTDGSIPGGLAILKERRIDGLLKGCTMGNE